MLEQELRDHTPARLAYQSITGKIHDQYIFQEQIDLSVYTSTIFQAKYT